MDNKSRILLTGTLLGAVTGLAAAMLFYRQAERTGREIAITTGEGFQLGLMVIGLLRAISGLGDEEKKK
jgi:gas vesicle protein